MTMVIGGTYFHQQEQGGWWEGRKLMEELENGGVLSHSQSNG